MNFVVTALMGLSRKNSGGTNYNSSKHGDVGNCSDASPRDNLRMENKMDARSNSNEFINEKPYSSVKLPMGLMKLKIDHVNSIPSKLPLPFLVVRNLN